jgi:hypothetical protein
MISSLSHFRALQTHNQEAPTALDKRPYLDFTKPRLKRAWISQNLGQAPGSDVRCRTILTAYLKYISFRRFGYK